MSRPATFKVDNTVYWVIRTYTDAGVLVDADSTPTVAVRKNGASTADSVTVTKRATTTGIYDCSYNPAGEVEGDLFTIEETATISAQAYENSWGIEVLAAERGTDGANTVAPDNAGITANGAAVAALNDFDYLTQAVDVGKISGDSVAADNLELQYDGTGLTGGNFPAFQDQLANLTLTGAANHTPAASYTLTTGTQSANTFAATKALDGQRHEHTDVGGAIDLYYEFNIGSGTAESFEFSGYLAGSNDTIAVQAYDWVDSAWVQIGSVGGSNSSANTIHDYILYTSMAGTGANLGTVRIRFIASSGLTSSTLAIDQCFIAFAKASSGYDGGSVWLDGVGTNTNTVVGVDGVATNPVSTIAAATTLLNKTNLHRLTVQPSTSVTLTQAYSSIFFMGEGWSLNTNGQDISDCHFIEAEVSGTYLAASGAPDFHRSELANATIAPTHFHDCEVTGPVTLGVAGDYSFFNCHSGIAGASSPVFNKTAGQAVSVQFRRWSGGVEFNGIEAGDTMTISGELGTVTLNGAGGTVEIRGTYKAIVDNRTGSPVLGLSGAINQSSAATETADSVWDEPVSSHNVAGSFGKAARQVKEGLVTVESAVNDLSATTTSFVTDLTEATSSFYSDKVLVFVSGSLAGQSRIITSYNGTTKAVAFDEALSFAPADGDEFIILSMHTHSVAQLTDAVWDELSSEHIAPGSFGYYLDAQVSTAGSGGSGLYQATVRVQDSNSDALQGARVNVDGTTLTLTTDSSGEVTFNLDSGVYLLDVSPPAGYDTPVGQVLTITSSDPADTVFTLTQSTPPGGCDVPWIG